MEKFNKRNLGPACLFTFLLFLMCLEDLTGIAPLQMLFKHIDELMVLGCLVYLVLHIHYVFKKKRILLYLWLGFMAIGAVSSLVFQYQSLIPSLIDALVVVSKFMVGYLAAYVYASLHKGGISCRLEGAARIITVVLFVIAVHDLLLPPLFPLGEYRYFSYSLVLMFPHSTYLAAAMATLLVLLGYTNQSNENIPYMVMASFVGMMTLRGKAIAFFAVYWMLYISIMVFKNRNFLALLVGGGMSSVVIGFEQISTYFLTSSRFSPRQILLKDGIHLAANHFPLGTGFGSFGSTIAAQYYSPLYTQLGYTSYDGMSPNNTSYLSDSFWPEIIAQFGFIGTVLFVALVSLFLIYSIRKLRRNTMAGFSMLAIMVNMLINSIAESSFFNPASFLLFMVFALCETER